MEEKTEDKHDPGWNDPPIFSYDKATAIQSTATTRKGALLNKRVAYPITGKSMAQNPMTGVLVGSPLTTPPVSVMGAPPTGSCPVSQTVFDSTLKGAVEKLNKNEKLNRVMKNLELLVPSNGEEEITKRIKIMEKMWMDDKLDEQVQVKLIDLTDALSRGDFNSADHLQKGLMVDYVSQCSSWMSGIRQLINLKRNSQ